MQAIVRTTKIKRQLHPRKTIKKKKQRSQLLRERLSQRNKNNNNHPRSKKRKLRKPFLICLKWTSELVRSLNA